MLLVSFRRAKHLRETYNPLHFQLIQFSWQQKEKDEHCRLFLVIPTIYFGQIISTEVRSYIKLLKNKNKSRNKNVGLEVCYPQM